MATNSAASEGLLPFNRSSLVGRELEYIFTTMSVGQIAGDQTFSRKCHRLLEEVLGVRKALLTTSCTHALEMSAILLDLKPGDEVIVPAFTFVSGVNAFVLRGARPVFCDIRADTLNLDESLLEDLISEKTKAVVPVHYAGVGCEMDRIMEISRRSGIAVIEDNAHGLFGKYKGRLLGTFGCMAAQSFHETKNITCGEGGALLINDPSLIERAEIIREKGTNRSRFFRGEVDKYTWVDIGSSYLMSDVLAAFLYGQLEEWRAVQERRRAIWQKYSEQLGEWANEHSVRLPFVPECCEQAFHMFYLLMPSLRSRQDLIRHLKSKGISAVFHYLPLHLSSAAQRYGEAGAVCPVSEDVSDRLLRLPFYYTLSEEDQKRVISAIQEFRP